MTDKIKEVSIHMGTFDFTVNFIYGDYEEATKYVDKKFEESADHEVHNKGYTARGRTWNKPSYCPIVWIPRKPSTPREYATLAHEMFHATCVLLHWAGVPLTDASEEVYAHAQAHLITSAIAGMRAK